jgi:hypothetical protein
MLCTTQAITVIGASDRRNYFPFSQEFVMRITRRFLLAVIAIVLSVSGSNAAQGALINAANGKSIIGGTGDIGGGAYNVPSTFSADNITDGQNATPDNDTGTITEPGQDGSYWLGTQGESTGYLVIDLGTTFTIDQIVLFNTSNWGFQDSGTGNFTVKASNSITNLGALGDDLSGTIVTLASGTLSAQSPVTLVPQSFASADNVNAYRYIRFDALSIAVNGTPQRVGLNELRLLGTEFVPEPTSTSLMIIGIFGVIAARRRSKQCG